VSVLAPPLAPEVRDKISELITDILFSAQELAFCLLRLKCDKKDQCELASKSLELAERVSDLIKIQREMTRSR